MEESVGSNVWSCYGNIAGRLARLVNKDQGMYASLRIPRNLLGKLDSCSYAGERLESLIFSYKYQRITFALTGWHGFC